MKAVKKHAGALKNGIIPGPQAAWVSERERVLGESFPQSREGSPETREGRDCLRPHSKATAGQAPETTSEAQSETLPTRRLHGGGGAGDSPLLGVLCLNIFQPLVAAEAASVSLPSASRPQPRV